jgi:hypothetical protein
MRSFNRFVAALLIASTVLVVGSGCGQAPTAPIVPASTSTSATAGVAATPGAAAQSSSLLGGLVGTVGTVVGGLVKLVVRTLDIVGNIGGTLINGRFRVDVPAGAIDGNATISISTSAQSPECQLDITPADRNHFAVPVKLTIDCSSVSPTVLRNYVVLWWNPATSAWEAVPGSTVDLNKRTVSAPLQHFSRYSVGPADGKAGW